MASLSTITETTDYVLGSYGIGTERFYRLKQRATGNSLTVEPDEAESFREEMASYEFAFPRAPKNEVLAQMWRSYYVAGVSH